MRVNTNQEATFLDGFIEVPKSELDVLEQLIDWEAVSKKLRNIKGDYRPLSLFKMMLLQTWHNMSDVSISSAVSRDLVYMRFCGFSFDGKKPDASTLCRFRNQLVQSGKLERLLSMVNKSIEEKGLKVSDGKYVSSDATLIQSSRRPRKQISSHKEDEVYVTDKVEYSDDEEASWVKKGQKLVYGYSSSVTTDENGLVESVDTTTASTSEMSHFPEMIDKANLQPGKKVLYDKGACSEFNRRHLKERGLLNGIMEKKAKGKKMSHWSKLRNKLIAKRRFVTERTFGTMKRTYGMGRARYLSLAKTHAEVLVKSIAYNLKRAINVHKLQVSCAQN